MHFGADVHHRCLFTSLFIIVMVVAMEELGKFHHAYWFPGLGEETSEIRETESIRKLGIYYTPESKDK